jgi:hypothetical protein
MTSCKPWITSCKDATCSCNCVTCSCKFAAAFAPWFSTTVILESSTAVCVPKVRKLSHKTSDGGVLAAANEVPAVNDDDAMPEVPGVEDDDARA